MTLISRKIKALRDGKIHFSMSASGKEEIKAFGKVEKGTLVLKQLDKIERMT